MSDPRTIFGRPVGRVHCVGVGGMGVGPLALYLAGLGLRVSGEDDAPGGEMQEQLRRAGVELGASGELAEASELVVCSAAIGATHPTLAAAVARGVPVVRRGEMLAEITREKKLVAVCGSHGKTTTTALLVSALRAVGFEAGYVLGGLFADGRAPAAARATSEWVVAEVDESDGTIAAFSPEITVAVNLDWDHADFYRTPEELERAFAGLFARTRGAVLVNAACEMSARARDRDAWAARPCHSFGPEGDFRGEIAAQAARELTLRLGGKFALGEAAVRARGEFNALNATAALAAAQLMGATITRDALANFPGVRRRQSVLHASESLTVVEDYAHHPAEIRALLSGLREGGARRLVVVFQPHRFSRTAQFKRDFAAALAAVDALHVLDVYPAGEQPLSGGSTADLLAELRATAPTLNVRYAANDDASFFRELTRGVRRGDLVVFVGAGDIERKARHWLATARWDEFVAEAQPRLSAETRVKREEPLAAKTTMRVGGAARVYAEPASVADLRALLRLAAERAVEIFMLGRGSNLLVPDEGVDGLVISLGHPAWTAFEPRAGGRVWAGAGLRLKNLCGLAAKTGLVGFEFLEGIPGNLGGALRMNAGAMGGWMFDVVEEVQLMTRDGEVRTLPKSALHVEYRHCAELDDAIALGALLLARPGQSDGGKPAAQSEADAINRQIDVYRRKRHETQPREPSAGCIFKNPPGSSAGKLIDESGLKGERVGDAEVSPVHANFIVNRGDARAGDVLALVRRVRERVRERTGITLQPEVLLYGKKWEDVL